MWMARLGDVSGTTVLKACCWVASIHARDHMGPGNVLPIGQAGNLASDE